MLQSNLYIIQHLGVRDTELEWNGNRDRIARKEIG